MPIDGSVPYHLHYKVLNAKKHGVPQNRERVFLIGIRDDQDNTFTWPEEEELTKRLKDVLEEEVFEKYFLSEERIGTITNAERGIDWTDANKKNTANCIISGYYKQPTDGEYIKVKSNLDKYYLSEKMINYISKDRKGNDNLVTNREVANTITCEIKKMQRSMQDNYIDINKLGYINQDTQASALYSDEGLAPTMCAGSHGYAMGYINVTNYQATIDNYKIRRLTPRECFRLMDFPDTFTWPVSDSQAYKQAGNSIVVRVLEKIINNLPL